ncbi:class I SAM-dependent methyltransferase [Haladaptatus sp. GCM10025707]|uniref:class I SAM-dependent methyltransferase n=1 Tax=Haladaptatus sp. GCM10025707 TaxID=3252658 RepID=UPI003613FF8E
MYAWARLLNADTKFISIDLPGGEFGGGYSENRQQLLDSFSDAEMTFIRANSHSADTIAKAAGEVLHNGVDFLFIDGDHTYEGVKADWTLYRELVNDGGIVAFHDIAPHPEYPNSNVDQLWDEIKEDYDTTEFIEDSNQGWAGIGLVHL